MSDDTIRAVWDAAVSDCTDGHGDCTFGGMSIPYGYWLAAEDCTRNHGEQCVWCGADTIHMFRGRVGVPLVGELYAVPACEPCGKAWIALNPGQWT